LLFFGHDWLSFVSDGGWMLAAHVVTVSTVFDPSLSSSDKWRPQWVWIVTSKQSLRNVVCSWMSDLFRNPLVHYADHANAKELSNIFSQLKFTVIILKFSPHAWLSISLIVFYKGSVNIHKASSPACSWLVRLLPQWDPKEIGHSKNCSLCQRHFCLNYPKLFEVSTGGMKAKIDWYTFILF